MAFHAEYALRRPGIFEIFNLLFAIPTLEAIGTKRLIPRENGQVLDLVRTDAAAICTVVADEGAIAEE